LVPRHKASFGRWLAFDELVHLWSLAGNWNTKDEVQANHDQRSKQVVGARPGKDGGQALQNRTIGIGSWVVGRNPLLARVETGDLDKPTERHGGDLIFGIAALKGGDARTKADRKAIDAHLGQPRDQKVATFMDDYEQA